MRATARAHANIALIKYWGKRDEALFLPTNGSLSLTLDRLYTTTSVEFREDLSADAFSLAGVPVSEKETAKVGRFLDKVRALSGDTRFAVVDSVNDVPTAAGLASSASGFAALAAAASRAAGLDLSPEALSRLARHGSGAACRSIFGGFAEWRRGARPDGEDSHGVAIAPADHWDLRMLVTILEAGPKAVSSRDGMRETVKTSPFYPGWLATIEADLAVARRAVRDRDFEALGSVAEANALKMHATMLGASPPFSYLKPASVALWEVIGELRRAGVPAYFTMDAGPNVKVLVEPAYAAQVEAALRQASGVVDVIACGPGPGIAILEDGCLTAG
jgi:diphosphomevalonate decarboxylase